MKSQDNEQVILTKYNQIFNLNVVCNLYIEYKIYSAL